MQWLPILANNKGMIQNDAENLYRAQSTDGVLMTIMSWINEYTGEVDNKTLSCKKWRSYIER